MLHERSSHLLMGLTERLVVPPELLQPIGEPLHTIVLRLPHRVGLMPGADEVSFHRYKPPPHLRRGLSGGDDFPLGLVLYLRELLLEGTDLADLTRVSVPRAAQSAPLGPQEAIRVVQFFQELLGAFFGDRVTDWLAASPAGLGSLSAGGGAVDRVLGCVLREEPVALGASGVEVLSHAPGTFSVPSEVCHLRGYGGQVTPGGHLGARGVEVFSLASGFGLAGLRRG